MCWQDSPGSRASLRELRIMLLHLHSASRGDPDTTSFDQKWNQLMPRQLLPNAEDTSAVSGNNSVSPQVVDIVDVDLGTISETATNQQPVALQSDFLDLNASPNPVQPSVTSSSFFVAVDNSAVPSSCSARSPVNEMSLASELGALGMFEAPHNDDMKYTTENSHATAHISVLAEIHSEKSNSPNVPFTESMDITDQFSSPHAEPISDPHADTYASYLKIVNTSVVDGDEEVVDDTKVGDLP